MQRIFYFFRKIVLSPFILLARSMGVRIILFGYPPSLIPIPSSLSASWSELVNQIRKAKSNKHTSLYPTYFLLLESVGTRIDAHHINKGSFIDPLGNVYSYDHSGGFPGKPPANWRSFKDSIEDSEIYNVTYEDLPLVHILSQEISKKDLLINISNSKKEKTKYDNIEINLEKIVRNISRYGYGYGAVYPEMIGDYSSILIYDETKDVYKQIVFKGYGLKYNSWYISKLDRRLPYNILD